MNFKHGEKVTCKIEGEYINDARISIDSSGIPFICQNFRDGTRADDKLGYKFSWTFKGAQDVKHALKSFDYPEVGDEYKDSSGNSRFVLGVAGRVIFFSRVNDFNLSDTFFTKEELINKGYTIVQDTPEDDIIELTLEDIATLKGVDVKRIKIKK